LGLAMANRENTGSWRSGQDHLQGINSSLADVVAVRWIADKFGIQPWVVAAACISWTCGFLLWGFTGELVCTIVATLYPMYASFKALEDRESEKDEEVFRWLRYWTTYAALSLGELVSYRMLVWMPFYHLLRILVVIWLFLPATRGADKVYNWVVRPLLSRYSPRIDAALARSADEVRGTLGAAAGCAGASEIRSVLRKAAIGSAGYVARDLGMEDLMMSELTKTASAKLRQAAYAGHENAGAPGARARVSSPAPRFTPVAHENKDINVPQVGAASGA